MATARRLNSLDNFAFGDRELLYVVHDLADKDGWVEAKSVADRLGIIHTQPTRCVVARFAWMRRYGVMERNDEDGDKWRLTDRGEQIRRGSLTKAAQKAIEGLNPNQLIYATEAVAKHYRTTQVPEAVTLMRRAWKHTTGLRS